MLDRAGGGWYANIMIPERRAAPRIRAYRPVRLHQSGNSRIIETLTKDLSEGGICCLSPIALPVSSEVSLELVLSTGQAPISVRGRTAWFRTIPQSEQFDLGIAFDEISPVDKRRLSAYLDQLSSKSVFLLSV